jgi:nitroreductase
MSYISKLKKIAKKILGLSIVQKIIRTFNLVVLSIASNNRLFSIVYHWINFFPYSREQHAFVKAKYKNIRDVSNKGQYRSGLRRNIHRLEKGLIMRERRDVFGTGYIQDTVKKYVREVKKYNGSKQKQNVDLDEILWARDVLEKYFASVKKNPRIEKAKRIYKSITLDLNGDSCKIPYIEEKRENSNLSYSDFYNLTLQRRSIRWFKDKKVPKELIDKALKAAVQSPSACNRIPYKFKIFNDPKLAKKIGKIPFGTSGYAYNIPAIAVLIGEMSNYKNPRDRHLIYVDSSLAAMTFMYALETLGVSSTAIHWPDFELLEIKMQKTLGLDVDQRPVMLIAFGYPDKKGQVPFSQKKPVEFISDYNDLDQHSET